MRRGAVWLYLQAATALALGLVLLLVAVPRLVAQVSLAATPASPDAALTPAELDEAIASAVRAVSWQPGDRDAYQRLAMLWLRGFDLQAAAEDWAGANQSRDQVHAVMQAGLEVAPGAPDLWFGLARIEAARGEFSPAAAAYLRNSYLTGPREQWVGVQRVLFAVTHWAKLDPSLKGMVQRELRYQPPRTLARLTYDAPPDLLALIEAEAQSRPESQKKTYDRELKRISGPSS
ncbi:hypothetical protein [Rhodoligotrophos defluvii]|uniref:hypothetical protein n=1 Tax=Rhodoligotrophos defluvii TaxID=2561934 RepID=UPI0010C93E72|nr:hypothetical protein [Rhodoligotrophos defluvii]